MVQMQKRYLGLDSHFTYGNLFRFVLSPILMMVFTSIYGVVDGFFISNFSEATPEACKTAFSAINVIMPITMILGAVGFMIGTGGTAIVSKTLGEGDKERANNYFSFLIYATVVIGIIISVVAIIFLESIARLLGIDDQMMPFALTYGRIVIAFTPTYMLQSMFQSFFITAERPKLGFKATLIAGCTNMVLDALFVWLFKWSVAGAAIATGISQLVGAIIPIVYFTSKRNDSLLRLGKGNFNGKVLLDTCTNGASELVSNISGSIVSIVFNKQLINIAGQDGPAAYGVMMYVNFIYVAIFIGYAIGTAPIIGFNYGAKNKDELKNIFTKSLKIMAVFGVIMTILAFLLAKPISKIFVGYDENLYNMTVNAFRLFCFSFVFTGFGIFGSSMFTALGNGAVSAIISFLRTLVFQIACVLVLPIFWGINGVWLSMLFAEILSSLVTIIFWITKRKKYGYV